MCLIKSAVISGQLSATLVNIQLRSSYRRLGGNECRPRSKLGAIRSEGAPATKSNTRRLLTLLIRSDASGRGIKYVMHTLEVSMSGWRMEKLSSARHNTRLCREVHEAAAYTRVCRQCVRLPAGFWRCRKSQLHDARSQYAPSTALALTVRTAGTRPATDGWIGAVGEAILRSRKGTRKWGGCFSGGFWRGWTASDAVLLKAVTKRSGPMTRRWERREGGLDAVIEEGI